MRYSGYIGRVGALAVALGIGGAVANGTGVALATPESDDQGVESPAPADPPSTDQDQSSSEEDETVRPRDLIAGALESLVGSRHDSDDNRPDLRDLIPRGGAVIRSNGVEIDGNTTRTVVVERESSKRSAGSTPHKQQPERVASMIDNVAKTVNENLKQTNRRPAQSVRPHVEQQQAPQPDPGASFSTPNRWTTTKSSAGEQEAPKMTLTSAEPTRTTAAVERPRLLPRLLTILGLGVMPGNGQVPENPVVAAVLGWVRRLDRAFDNETPITDYRPQQTVQVDADRAVGYLDPVDPDRDRLTYRYTTTKGGAVAFDQTIAGKFTYTAPEGRDETVEWTDTVTITTSDEHSGPHIHGLRGLFARGAGHTTTQTVTITLKPVTEPTVGTDGTVSGRVPADNATLTYTTGGDLSSAVGIVEVHENGTWTFSPTAAARYNAANGGAQAVSFTLVARDGEHQTPISVTAPIARSTDTAIPVQPGTSPTGNVATGSDGSIVQASTDGDKTYVTVIDRNGVAHISQPLAGAPVGDVVAARGNAYQATYDGTNTHINIVLPDGSVKTAVVQGQTEGAIVVGPDGEAYITSTVAGPVTLDAPQGFARIAFSMQTMAVGPLNPDTGGTTSNVTVLGVDGNWFTASGLPGAKSGDVVVADDGYAYQTTYRSQGGVYETYVTVINKDTRAWETTDAVDGEPRQLIIASDGAAYQLVYQPGVDSDGDGVNEVPDKTMINAISHDASFTQDEIAGDTIASDIVADGDGRVYLTTSATLSDGSRRSYIMTIDPGGVVQTAEMPGHYDYRKIIFDDEGYAYLTSYENTDDTGAYAEHTYVTVIAPGGDIPDPNDAAPILGTPRDGVFIGRDGKTYITTSDGSTVKVNAIAQDGTVVEVASLSGSAQEHALVGADGTVFVTTYQISPEGDPVFVANVVEPNGDVHPIPLRGNVPDRKVVMDPNGVVYQPSYDQDSGNTYVTVIHADGTSQETVGIPGQVFTPLVVAPDGTVYQTSYSFEEGNTYVSVIGPNGTVRTSQPINAPTSGGVIFGPGGKVLQPVPNGAAVALNPSTWELHAPPAAQIGLPDNAKPVTPPVFSGGELYQASYDESTGQGYLTVIGSDGVPHHSAAMPGKPVGDVQFGKGGIAYQLTAASGYEAAYVNAITPDGDVITTTLRGRGGSLVVGPDGTVAAASFGNDGTFVTVFDAAGVGHDVIFDGAGTENEITELPGFLKGNLAIDSQGNVYAATAKQDSNGRWDTNIAVIAPDGSIRYIDQAAGEEATRDGIVMGSNGPAYLVTEGDNQTFVIVMTPDSILAHPIMPGEPTEGFAIGANGTAYVSTWDQNGTSDDFSDDRFHVFSVDANGAVIELADEAGIGYETPAVGRNGEVYQTYATYDSNADAFTTRVVVIDSGGNLHLSDPMPGVPDEDGVQIGQDGVAYQVIRPSEDADETYIYTVAPNGATVRVGPLPGQLSGQTRYVAPDGTTYVLTYTRVDINNQTRYTSHVTVVGLDGVPHTTSIPRRPEQTPGNQVVVVGADGTIYQLTLDDVAQQNYVTTIRPDGTVHLGTPMPGEDPTYQALVKAPDGTVYLTSTVQGPGGVGGETYVAIVQPDGGVKFGAPLSGSALAGVVIGPNGTLYQATTAGTFVLDPSSWVVRHAPEDDGDSFSVDEIAVDGTVTGSMHATDLDNDTLSYEADPDNDVAVDVLGDGTWTFTPTQEQREAAFYGTGPDEVTFTVFATDGKYRTAITVVAPIDPVMGPSLVLPAGARPVTSIFVDDDGTAYQASYDQGSNNSYLTVIDGGSAVTSAPMPGKAFGDVKIGKGGITYLTTIESGSEQVYVNAITPDGDLITTTLRGRGGGLVVGPDGTIAATSYVSLNGGYSSGDGPFETYVTVFDATGHPHDADPIIGTPRNNVVIGRDGTLYQATSESPGTTNSFIAVIAPDGTTRSWDSLGGEEVVGDGVVVGAVGPAYLTTSGTNSTFVTIIESDGTMHRPGTSGLPGLATGSAVIGADGTAYVSTRDTNNTDELDDDTAHLYAISPSGTATELVDVPGIVIDAPVLGRHGELYQSYVAYEADPETFTTYTLVIDSGGTQHLSDPMAGLPRAGVQLGQDGVAYQLIQPDQDVDESVVYTVAADGQTREVGPLPGDLSPLGRFVAADGTTYLVSGSRVDVNNQTRSTTHMTIIGADGHVETGSVPRPADFGRAGQSLVVGDDGTLYQVTVDGSTLQNYTTTMNPDGTVHSGTPLPGDYPAYQSLVKAPDGTVYMTSSRQGPGGVGGQTYVAIVQSDGGIRTGDPIAGRALAGVVVGADGTVYQTTTEGTYVLDTSSWTVRHAPEDDGDSFSVDEIAVDGTVTGSMHATDLDNETLSYEADPDSDVAVDVLGDGSWSFTPTQEQRTAAFYGTGPDEVTFTIYATDGTYRTPITVVAPIDPDTGTTVVLPAGATPTGGIIVTENGTAYQRSHDQATNTSYLTVIRDDGTGFTSDEMPGSTIDGPLATTNGTLYQLSWDSVADKTYLNIIDQDGTVTSSELTGQIINSLVAGPNNTVYQTTQESADGHEFDTLVTVAGPGGVHTTEAIPGGLQAPIVVDGSGNAYLTTIDESLSFVTVVNASGEAQTTQLSRRALGGVVLGSTGTAYVATREGNQTFVATIDPDGTVHDGVPLVGRPTGVPVADANGNVIQTTYDRGNGKVYVSAIAADGSVAYDEEVLGATATGPVVGPDGTVYQMFYTVSGDPGAETYKTYVIAISADGSRAGVTGEINALAHVSIIRFRDDGVAYLITNTQAPDAQQTYVTTFDNQGSILDSIALRGLPIVETYHVGAGGTVYIATYKQVPSSGDPQETYINFVDSAGVVREVTVNRAPYFGGIAVDDDGTVYQLTIDYAADQTYVTTIDSNGIVHHSAALAGQMSSLVTAPDGTVYVTTSVNDGAQGLTYVATVGADGSLRVSDALAGFASGGVVVGGAGTAYQSTDRGTALLDPSEWSAQPASGLGLPAGAAPSGPLVVDDDGSAFQMSFNEATNASYLTVIRNDGTAFTSVPVLGEAVGNPVSGDDGNTYVLTDDGGEIYLNVVADDGSTSRTVLPDATPTNTVVTADGLAYVTTLQTGPNGEPQTVVAIIGPNGVPVAVPIGGQPNYEAAVVGSDGRVYQTTSTGGFADGLTAVTIISPNGSYLTIGELPGIPSAKAVVDDDGTVYQTTQASIDGGRYETYVTVIGADGIPHTTTALTGEPVNGGLVVGPGGLAYQTTYEVGVEDHRTHVYVVSPDGSFVNGVPVDGTAVGSGAVVDADGRAYQATRLNQPTAAGEQGRLMVVEPNGDTGSFLVAGSPRGEVALGSENTVYQAAYQTNPADGSEEAVITVVHLDGGVVNVSQAVRGSLVEHALVATPDGTVLLTTTRDNETTVTAVGVDGSLRTVGVFSGAPGQGVTVGPDGTVYQTTSTGTWVVDTSEATASM